jgi:long-chain fatty acid transport protein
MERWQHAARGTAVAVAILASAVAAHGAGFQVSEQTVVGLGRAFAGAGVVGDDLSAVFYNPAAMTLLEGTGVQAGITFVLPSAVFEGDSTRVPVSLTTGMPVGAPTVESGRGGGGGDTQVPHLYFVTDILHERVRLGIGGTVPFGLITDYDRDWVGRYHALRSILRSMDFNPSVAVRVNDHLSIGAGMSAQYASVSLSRAVFTGMQDGLAKVSGTDWSYGWNVGVLLELNERLRGGVGFRSKVKHTLDGELRLTGLGPASRKIDAEATTQFPETVHADVFAQVTDRLGLSFGARWTNWSRFEELRVRFADPAMPDDVVRENWHDTWMLKIGLDYAVLPGLVVRSGFAWDQTPVENATFRTPRIPDASRYWLAAGLSYRPFEALSVDVGYAHLFSKSAEGVNSIPIAEPAPGTALVDRLEGEFSGRADIVGASATWRF